MISRILVPLDGSDLAELVLPYVKEMAARTGAEVLLLNCVQPVGVWDATITTLNLDREESFALAYLDSKREPLASGGIRTRAIVVQGQAAEAILQAAADEKADLIAMTTHGRSGISRWLFGSVAAKILEGSEAPLFLARAGAEMKRARRTPEIKKVLVPLDGSSLAESVLPFVEDVARAFSASIVLFHAIVPLTAYPGFETVAPMAVGDVLQELQKQADQFLSRLADEIKARGLVVETAASIDLAVDGILQAAKTTGAGLVALGTHGRSGLGRAVMGSVADAVVRRADLPCLLMHPKEPATKQ